MQFMKKINNNVALVQDEQDREWIVIGRGISFRYQKDDVIEQRHIERRFLAEPSKDFSYIIDTIFTIEEKLIEAINEMIAIAEEHLGIKFKDNNYLTLVDHIQYAFIREESRDQIASQISWETQKLYPREYQTALLSVQFLEQKMEKKLPHGEEVFIALHYINASDYTKEKEQQQYIDELINKILRFIHLELSEKAVDKNSANYARFVTHLRYFIIRQIKKEKIVDEVFDAEFENMIQTKYERAYHVALGVAEKLRREESWIISMNEVLYLTLHIWRIFYQS